MPDYTLPACYRLPFMGPPAKGFQEKGDGGFLFSSPRAAAFVALTLPRPVTVYDVATKKQVKVIQLEQGLAPKRMQMVSVPKSTTEN